jgi:hypothetical protein
MFQIAGPKRPNQTGGVLIGSSPDVVAETGDGP